MLDPKNQKNDAANGCSVVQHDAPCIMYYDLTYVWGRQKFWEETAKNRKIFLLLPVVPYVQTNFPNELHPMCNLCSTTHTPVLRTSHYHARVDKASDKYVALACWVVVPDNSNRSDDRCSTFSTFPFNHKAEKRVNRGSVQGSDARPRPREARVSCVSCLTHPCAQVMGCSVAD